MKHFTLAEAEALIPELERIFEAVLDIRGRAMAKAESMRRIEAAGTSDPARMAMEKAQWQFLMGGLNDWLEKIVELGGSPKGLAPALVDFPFKLGDREVHLCWELGEKRITHYHGLEEGFAGRKPLPDHARKGRAQASGSGHPGLNREPPAPKQAL